MLYGAVVGGPDETDCWNDDRVNWERNEVALDYNAPYPGLLAWTIEEEDRRPRGAAAHQFQGLRPPGRSRLLSAFHRQR